ncbi:GGDEF domain-containing protein [Sinimarinibacterium sp. CAU 1509]|uniref:EAL domain-containing protein n=1 Tax=Sinimarinibacterium sp. CAU 1509 TaxID=2562283 RepID=UPI0010AD80E3|nr:bifunctional diguanylate cyclase/phosphodiesterase [Sinimarinibacterium sp. CAU 1509]TJY61107.1 GGDEF domain-containing protein [Sinimarinibacterium sp. CAU 1509]
MSVSNLGEILDSLGTWHPYPHAMLLYVDIRHMRSVNRLAIAGGGDEAISQVQEVLRAWAGSAGIANRIWSNEFVAAKAIDHSQTAIEEAQILRNQLTDIHYRSVIGDNPLAVSIGLIVVGDHAHWAEVVANAAEACETAKRRGLNQIATYTPHHGEAQMSDVNAANVVNFRRLMVDGRLDLHPQPIMDISGAHPRLAKAEFLLRMEQDGRYLPLPAGTIETLEYFGLSPELDAFTSTTVMAWMAKHPDAVAQLDGVSMNLSAKSLVDGRFMHRLFNEVEAMRLPPGKLGFEITETAAIEHLELAADIIEEFRSIGCNFSLDDFGSGLCSFGYLHSLGVNEVKIDGRFVRDIAQNPVSQEIVRAIHQVAQATGKKTVAEFVDEPRKLQVLQGMGIDYAQGWLFYPAIPTAQFLELLSAETTR